MKVLRMMQAAMAVPPRFALRRCALCGHRIGRFIPYAGGLRGVPKLMHALNMVGSDVEHFECPRCGSHDRERHVFLYLQYAGLLSAMRGKRVLHFAPEKGLSRIISELVPTKYVKCDLHPRDADVLHVDMLAMPFEEESFDFVIANHVLEHVDDDLQALGEIRRVLAEGGHAVLQTPFSAKLQRTWSDVGIADASARTQAFGQADHVRLYGTDIFERFASVGLVSLVQGHRELLQGVSASVAGVNADEPFFLFVRGM